MNARAHHRPARSPPVSAAATTAGAVYTCPMHPEIRQDRPGHCPKCGMTLEPVLPTLEEGENAEPVDLDGRAVLRARRAAGRPPQPEHVHADRAGLCPATGWLLSPIIAALAMSLSSASVIFNALRLRATPKVTSALPASDRTAQSPSSAPR